MIMSRLIFGLSNASSVGLDRARSRNCGDNDPHRMRAPHQRNGDADEVDPGGIFEDQPMFRPGSR